MFRFEIADKMDAREPNPRRRSLAAQRRDLGDSKSGPTMLLG